MTKNDSGLEIGIGGILIALTLFSFAALFLGVPPAYLMIAWGILVVMISIFFIKE